MVEQHSGLGHDSRHRVALVLAGTERLAEAGQSER
jgi:hypothetical protein